MQEIAVSNLIHFRVHFSAYLRGFLTLNAPCISESRIEIKMSILTLLCGASKRFMRAFKTFVKPFEVPQRSVKIKI